MSVGLDIGSKTIKIVELVKDGDKNRLRASGVIGYSGNPIEHFKTDTEYSSLANAIKKLHKEAKISSKDVSISLPESQVFTRSVKFPLLVESEISSAVKWEAEQYIPIPIDEAIVQHQILETREDLSPPSTIVLLVAAPKNIVSKYSKVIQMAGFKLMAVETELMSMVRALAPKDKTAMIVDLGSRSTDIALAKYGHLSFSRSIPTAGEALTRAIAQSLGVEATQAEQYKKTYGLTQKQLEGKIQAALNPILNLVVDEMKKAIQFYKSEEHGEPPQVVLLSGGSSGLPNLTPTLTKMIGIEVVVGNPFANIVVTPQAAKSLAGFAHLYSPCVGLALRE
ncbi:type IV pilus assembly protein PilM [Patescibacteria group bacterium]